MQARAKTSVVFLLPLCLALSGCTLVGYPAGGPTASPDPIRAGAGPRITAEVRDDPEPVSTGRSYVVFGEEYRVLESSRGYAEEGLASWYGEKFHGRPTASGETYDMHGLSAAHRTLPLHTWVEVTNLENGRSLVLRVNDRGPFAHTDRRILDLSYAAAQELGVVATGTARVRVRALEASEVSSTPGVRS
jgi:rare lipoprotein A